ncbi:protein [Escherichia coli]|nr:protein [Escherichia coli]
MAKNRSRRLRKKMHIDEFQELGFSVHGDSRKVHRKNRLIKPLMILLTRLSNRTNWPLTAVVIWPGKV